LYSFYHCERPTICYTQSEDALYAIALNYPEGQLVLVLDKPADNMKVTLLGSDKTLPWIYRNGQLIIDTSRLKYSDLKSTAAWVFKMK
jgi:ABC-type arginine transport system ATPase subunit